MNPQMMNEDWRYTEERMELRQKVYTILLSRFGSQVQLTAAHTHAQYLDSPSTTSALVYQVQVRSTDGTATIGGSESTSDSNRVSTPTILTAMEIGA